MIGTTEHDRDSSRESKPYDGAAFEAEVAAVLSAMGYAVQPNRWKAGRQTDLVASRFSFPASLQFLVECKDWSQKVGVEVVTDMHARVDAVRRTECPDVRGWIIASSGFAMNAKEHATALGIHCTTYDELLGEMIDFRPYLERFVGDYENLTAKYLGEDGQPTGQPLLDIMLRCDLYRYFVPPDVEMREETPTPQKDKVKIEIVRRPANEVVMHWLADKKSSHMTILGDFGSGKSSFGLDLTYRLAKQHLRFLRGEAMACRVPLFVPLKEYYRRLNIESLVTNLLVNQYGVTASWSSLSRIIAAGRILLILDGFDEMVTRSSPHDTVDNLREVCKLAQPGTKTILTCRTHYFRDQREVDDTFGSGARTANPLMQHIRSHPHFRVLDLAPLNDNQIETLLRKRLGASQTKAVVAEMRRTYNLWDLSQRPVLCDMIIKTLPTLLKRGTVINAAQLYDAYTSHWLDTDDWRSIMTPAGKRRLMKTLAVQMFFSGQAEERQQIHYSELPEPDPSLFKQTLRHDPKAFDLYDHDTRTCSFLIRDREGNYRFVHKSFLEFFVANRLKEDINQGDPTLLLRFDRDSGNREVMFFLRGLGIRSEAVAKLLRETVIKRGGGQEVALRVLIPRLLEDLTPRGHAAWACSCYRAARAAESGGNKEQTKLLASVAVGESIRMVEQWIDGTSDGVKHLVDAVGLSIAEHDEVAYRVTSCARRAVAALYPAAATNDLAVRAAEEALAHLGKNPQKRAMFWECILAAVGFLLPLCGQYTSGCGQAFALSWDSMDAE
jgi:hypothetical protein